MEVTRPERTSAALLSVRDLCKDFGGLAALSDVSLDVEPGRVTSLIGPNGSGKTTLFNVLTGLVARDTGEIRFKSERIDGRRSHEIAALGIGRTFQNARLFPNLSIVDNVDLPQFTKSRTTLLDVLVGSAPSRAERRAVRERSERLLGEIGGGRLFPRRFDSPETCSLGEQRMVELIRVLALDPDLVMMDEPTQGLNPVWVGEMLEVVDDIRARGKTILFIEHKMNVVMSISDHVIVLNSGRKIAEGVPGEVRQDPAVIKAYLGA